MKAPALQAAAPSALSPQLQRAVQVLSDTYETLDLRIETTIGAAEHDFIAALPEVEDHEAELRHFVSVLIADMRVAAGQNHSQPVVLHLAFRGEDDLTQQILTLTGDATS
jgi:hypothetical protein